MSRVLFRLFKSFTSHLSSHNVAVAIKRLIMAVLAGNQLIIRLDSLLATGRVYLPRMSPFLAVSFYLTRFTLTLLYTFDFAAMAKMNAYSKRRFRFCGTFPRVTSGCR